MFPPPHTETETGTPEATGPGTGDPTGSGPAAGVVTVRLWAAARAAAGVPEVGIEVPGEVSVTWIRDEVVRRFAGRPKLPEVLAVCSTLVGDRPVGRTDPGSVPVAPGDTVEFLPPFAGG